MNYTISGDLLTAITAYLATKPWQEVNNLIQAVNREVVEQTQKGSSHETSGLPPIDPVSVQPAGASGPTRV
jgi:hypothetical protein